MKWIKIFLLLFCNITILWIYKVNAQNDLSNRSDECIPVLPVSYNFLKSFKVSDDNSLDGKLEYSYPFTKNTQYIIKICAENATSKGIVITLYDFHRNEIATSKINNQNLSTILFKCKTTGIYYISYTFENTLKFSGHSILGFKKYKMNN